MPVRRRVRERVVLGKRHDLASQAQQFVKEPLAVERSMLIQMRERGERAARGVQQPERGDVARAELDSVLGRLAIERVDLRLELVDEAA